MSVRPGNVVAQFALVDVKPRRTGREAVRAVSDLAPDLMFLDIKMPGWNGFDVIKKIQPEQLPMVVFCTAFERYALDAFEVHAVDYLVKPLDEDRVRIAVERAVARHREEQLAGGDKQPLLGAIEEITGNRAAPGGRMQGVADDATDCRME